MRPRLESDPDPRPFTPSATCRAPAVALHFSFLGDVRACCQNGRYEVGHVDRQSLTEIWTGAARREMAESLAGGEYPLGCEHCEVEHALGNRGSTPAQAVDRFPDDVTWPRQLEFTLSNRCNLACIQCNGDVSSTIRARREKRPPLLPAYDEAFFEQLPPFLDHAEVLAFLGGEPFLMPEARRVWDLVLERGLRPEVQVTTNATVWNERVERYVHELRMAPAVSIDGATKQTYESIRVGARYERVIENRDRFIAAAKRHGAHAQLNFCLMTRNWHELGPFLLQADELEVPANIIPVFDPISHSVFRLPVDELEVVVSRLEREERQVRPQLSRNRSVWDDTVRQLRGELERRRAGWARQDVRDVDPDAIERRLRSWSGRDVVRVHEVDGSVTSVEAPEWSRVLGVADWPGLDLIDLEAALERTVGPVDGGEVVSRDGHDQRELVVHAERRDIRLRAAYVWSHSLLLLASPRDEAEVAIRAHRRADLEPGRPG